MMRFFTPIPLAVAVLFIAAWGPAPGQAQFPAAAPGQWEERPVRLPPLIWYERDPEAQRRVLMLSMLYWDIQERATTHRLLLPVFYHWRDEDRTLLVSLPFVVSHRQPESAWISAGLFYRHADSRKTRTAFFPLYWQKTRRHGGRVTAALPFLFYDYRSLNRDRIDQISLAGWVRHRPDRTSGMWLNYWWSHSRALQFTTLFPLYWSVESPRDRWRVVPPFYWRTRPAASRPEEGNPEESDKPPPKIGPSWRWAGVFPVAGAGWGPDLASHYIFPLYLYSRVEGRRGLWTLPASRVREGDLRRGHVGIYLYSHDPDMRMDAVVPFWYRRKTADGFEEKTQFLNFYKRRENEQSFHTLFPLYGYWSSPEETRFLSWGLRWRQSPESSSGWAGLYYWSREQKDTTRILFPLYWHFWREPDRGLDLVFPFYARSRDGPTSLTVVPPVVVRKSEDRRTWSVLFLYWRDQAEARGSFSFFPVFHYNYNPRRQMFFSPVAWTRRSPASREGVVPPVYWYRSAESRHTVVLPVWWNTSSPDKSLSIVPPYYRWRRQDRLAYGVFPIWGRHFDKDERGGHFLPFYWYSRDDRGDGLWIIPPALMYVARRGTGTDQPRFKAQYLLLGNIQKSTSAVEHDFFPLYKYVRRDTFKNFWAPRGIALTAWEKDEQSRKGYVFPYVWRRSPSRHWDLFIPLWYHSSEFQVSISTPPVREKKVGGAAVFFPLYWAGRSPERAYRYVIPVYGDYKQGKRRFTALAPAWAAYDTPAGGKFRVFFPLYWRFLLKPEAPKIADAGPAQGDRDIVVAGPWFRTETRRDGVRSRTVGLAPLFARTVSGPEDRYFEILGGLFARDVQAGKRRFRFLYFFYTRPR
jgi:hypothetical protein